jgi:2-methylcitrate dehydratase PrpD
MTGQIDSLLERVVMQLLRPVPQVVRTKARLHLLDWLGCVAGARNTEVGRIQAADEAASPLQRATWLGNRLEMDDVHRAAILHPGPVVWPAALGVGGERLDEALEAAVRGYEAMIAIGATFDASHYGFWHNTATAGGFGAAAAAGARLGADVPQLVAAMGLAGSVTGGLWQMRHEPVMAKQWHLAHAVATGVSAARQARLGVTGPRFVLEGPQGLYAATCDAPKPLVLGEGWRIDEVSFKPWAACRHAHPAIDAALELRAQGALEGTIRVRSYRDALVFCDRPDPRSVLDAKFSLQHAVAVVMARGAPRLADFEPEAIAALAPQRALVRVEEDAAFTARYPAHFGAAVASASGEVSLIDTRGDPERPLDAEGIVAKARALMAWGGLSEAQASAAVAATLEGDSAGAVLALLEDWL